MHSNDLDTLNYVFPTALILNGNLEIGIHLEVISVFTHFFKDHLFPFIYVCNVFWVTI